MCPVRDGLSCPGCGLENYEGLCPVCRGDEEAAILDGLWPREPPVEVDATDQYDALFRKEPKRLFAGGLEMMRAIPGFAAQFTGRVPDEMMAKEDDDLVVPCPCGSDVRIGINELVYCPGDCGRIFYSTGSTVRVAGKPENLSSEPQTGVVH